jgi:hypothetical protein
MWDHLIAALSCENLYKYVCNAMLCETSCGCCECRCKTEEIELSDSDPEITFSADTCCGSVEYVED